MKLHDAALRQSRDPLSDLGFRKIQGSGGGMTAENCTVNIENFGTESELRIVLPNGNVVWCCTELNAMRTTKPQPHPDTPCVSIGIFKTAEEAKAACEQNFGRVGLSKATKEAKTGDV